MLYTVMQQSGTEFSSEIQKSKRQLTWIELLAGTAKQGNRLHPPLPRVSYSNDLAKHDHNLTPLNFQKFCLSSTKIFWFLKK